MRAADYRAAQAAAMLEADLDAAVLELAKARKWRTYHTRDSRRSEAGFPDRTFVRHGRLIFAELKTMRGRLSSDQDYWVTDLRMVDGIEVHVWRPADLLNGSIAAVLK